MKVAEVFASIQGEGLLAGMPSLFIRTSGCNLRCRWCDTPYTSWAPEGEDWPIERLELWTGGHERYRHVVVTGGEPMIQPELPPLTRALKARGFHVTIETAGTVWAEVECDLISLSPKLSNSTPLEADSGRWAERHDALRYRPGILRRLMAAHPYQLKYVVSEESDLAEILDQTAELGADRERVLLMPEGTEASHLRERGRWLVELCQRHGFRFCPRLHIELWGGRRGV